MSQIINIILALDKNGGIGLKNNIPWYISEELKLFKEKKVYYCFCTEEELESKRQEQMSRGLAPKYDGKCSHMSDEVVQKNLADKKPSVIRFRVANKKIIFNSQ